MTYRIRQFAVHQTAKLAAAAYALLSLALAPFILLAAAFDPTGEAFSIGFAIALPIIYGVFGYIFTALALLIYNLLASRLGGIEFQLESSLVEGQASIGKVFE